MVIGQKTTRLDRLVAKIRRILCAKSRVHATAIDVGGNRRERTGF